MSETLPYVFFLAAVQIKRRLKISLSDEVPHDNMSKMFFNWK